MSSPITTRSIASHSPRQQLNRQWGLPQMVRALYLHVRDYSVAEAAKLASTETSVVPVASLHRYYTAMMRWLPNAVNASEVDITAWIQQYESNMSRERQTGHTALTKLEEEMLVQWIKDAADVYQGVDGDMVKDKAREIIKSQRDIEWEGNINIYHTHTISYIITIDTHIDIDCYMSISVSI